jgi:hypothetical protein
MTSLKALPLVFLASAVTLGAEPIRLRVGAATTDGMVRFTLSAAAAASQAPSGGPVLAETPETATFEVPVAPGMSATAKANLIRAAVAAEPSERWSAMVSGASLKFLHLEEETWVEVVAVTDVSDTTGGGTQLSIRGNAVDINIHVSLDAVATGVDAAGAQSFFTVTLTDTLAWTHAIKPGEGVASLLDALQAFIEQQGSEGVLVVRESENSLSVKLFYTESQVSWQLTDTGLQPSLWGRATGYIHNAGLIDR